MSDSPALKEELRRLTRHWPVCDRCRRRTHCADFECIEIDFQTRKVIRRQRKLCIICVVRAETPKKPRLRVVKGG